MDNDEKRRTIISELIYGTVGLSLCIGFFQFASFDDWPVYGLCIVLASAGLTAVCNAVRLAFVRGIETS